MNPVEHLTSLYERAIQNEVLISEKIGGLTLLMLIELLVCLLLVLITAVNMVRRKSDHERVMTELAYMKERHDRAWELIDIAKDWANSARTHGKEAVLAAKEALPRSEKHIIEVVKAMPDATASKVVEEIHKSLENTELTAKQAGNVAPRDEPQKEDAR